MDENHVSPNGAEQGVLPPAASRPPLPWPAKVLHDDPIFRGLFISSPLPMWLLDPTTLGFLDVNPASVQKYGYTRSEFLGMKLRDLSPPDESTQAHAISVRRSSGLSLVSSGWRHAVKNGSVIRVDLHTWTVPCGGESVRLVIVHDVTGFHRATELLQARCEHLVKLFSAPARSG